MAKRALLIGINYFDTSCELNGCHNDVKSMNDLLISKFGFRSADIRVLRDVRGDKEFKDKNSPTRRNILQNLHELIAMTKPGDELFIHYSGHGSWTWDQNNDEKDGKDEILCPVDDTSISDDELYTNLVKKCPPGAKIRCVFDCCHSGTALDLPYRWRIGNKSFDENSEKLPENTDIILISGCRDEQTSADAYIGGNYAGALTWAFVECLKGQNSMKEFTWKDLIYNIRYNLRKEKYEQAPQMSYVNKTQMSMDVDI